MVYKYSCLVKNGLEFGEGLKAGSLHFVELMNCFFENNMYKAQECLKYQEDLIAGSGTLPTVELTNGDARSVNWELLDIDAGTAVSCAQKALKAGAAKCGTMTYINHSPTDGCFCYPSLGAITDTPGFNIYKITDTGAAAAAVDNTPFVELREIMDHYFYRMTSKVTDAEVTSFMCADGKRRTGMAFYTSPWADLRGVSMEPKWFLMSCSTFTTGRYIGGAVNSVDTVTHYYFDQPETEGRDLDDEEYEEEAKAILPVALDYNPLPYIFAGKAD